MARRHVRGHVADVRERNNRGMREWITSFRLVEVGPDKELTGREWSVDFFGRFVDGKILEGDLVELEGTERDGRIHTSDVLVLGSRRGGDVRGRVRGKWFDRRALAGFIASALISIVFLVLLIVGGTYVYWQVQSSSPQNGMANCLVTAPAEVCANLFGSGLPEPPTWDEKMEMCLEVSSRAQCNELLRDVER